MAELLEQLEVLHIACAHLDDVHILKQRQVRRGHDLRHDRQAKVALGLREQVQSLRAQALEGVGGGAGLERAAAQHGRAGLFDALGDLRHLLAALHGAGADHHRDGAVADLELAHVDDGVVRVEFAVGLLVRLLDAGQALHDRVGLNNVRVDRGGVPDQAQHGGLRADPSVDGHLIL